MKVKWQTQINVCVDDKDCIAEMVARALEQIRQEMTSGSLEANDGDSVTWDTFVKNNSDK